MLQKLAQALNDGDRASAGAILAQLRQQSPGDPNVRLFGAILDRQLGHLDASHAVLSQLLAQAPQHPTIRFQLANTLKEMQRLDEAAMLYRDLVSEQPEHADAAFNLGNCLLATQPELAGFWFLHASRHDPLLAEAHQATIECAAKLARSGPPSGYEAAVPTAVDEFISVICCSIDPAKLARLRANLDSVLANCRWELIHIDDARSLCEGYNRGLRAARGELIVLCHDDIIIHATDFASRLAHHLREFDLIGVAGTTRCCGPAAYWAGPPHIHGWVTYRKEQLWMPSLSSAHGPIVDQAQALDGLFLAARRNVFERLDFDEATFDRFHLYDIDFSWRAYQAGWRLGICQDLLIEHASIGDFSDDWPQQAQRFQRKFPNMPQVAASSREAIFMAEADSEDQVRATYAWLTHWLAALNESNGSPLATTRSRDP